MKNKSKYRILFITIGGLTATMVLWFIFNQEPYNLWSFLMLGMLLVVIGLSLYLAYNSYKNDGSGLSGEAEFSVRIREKAAARSFIYSIYMWTFGAMFLVDTGIRAEVVIGLGILGMGLLFLGTWLYLHKTSVLNENAG